MVKESSTIIELSCIKERIFHRHGDSGLVLETCICLKTDLSCSTM